MFNKYYSFLFKLLKTLKIDKGKIEKNKGFVIHFR